MNEQVWKAALAGLLHDVGKLGALAGEKMKGPYAHAAIGNVFVQQYVPKQWQPAMAPVGWHHGVREGGKPQPVEELGLPVKIVALADRLSSGEREAKEEDLPKVKQLLSVLGRVDLPEAEKDMGERPWQVRYWFKPAILRLARETLFPASSPSADADSSLRGLWEGLKHGAMALQQAYEAEEANIAAYLESMFYLLRGFTWCVPSAYWRSEPDISLFLHLHTTAALSACFAYSLDEGSLNEGTIHELLKAIKGNTWPNEHEIVGLLAGDLSGIQSFIYSLHDPEGAAASLRARSFYLQLLTEAIARWILRELGLPITNALYIGGGGFTLIVPPSTKDRLEKLRRHVNKTLYKAHGISLYLGLAYVGLSPADLSLESGGLAAKYEELGKKLDLGKAKRFSELPDDALREIFAPKGTGGEADEEATQAVPCKVCGLEVPRGVAGEERICPACVALQELGRKLIKAKYLFLAPVEPAELGGSGPHTWNEVLTAFGLRAEVLESLKQLPSDRPATLLSLEEGAELPAAPKLAVGRKFLVNLVPIVSGNKELEEIKKLIASDESVPDVGRLKHFGVLARQSQGAPYLGVLRMDMDNLGRIFSRGLGKYTSLSRVATLSFLVSLFFEGWVKRIAEEVCKETHPAGWGRIYTVYSGGDDLFFVGSWDAVVELARRIRRDLREFTGREDLGISGGIALVHEKFPLYVAAKDTEQAEKAAKDVRKKKDAFSFLGISLPWEEFGFDGAEGTAAAWAEKLADFMNRERLPRAVLERVQTFYGWYLREHEKRGPHGPWIWHAAYWFARLGERLPKEDGEAQDAVQKLKEALSGQGFERNIARLALAARWAELLTRKGG
ncbi:type III-A CRISPR-associated protein Cas10/Csm1 [Candidatus Bipolaricaulota bacterium]|nr:type III-A CRISPR-associated protein Cas10/Csm1 [Candidatus Bipolaricaulota bacterium]